MNNKYYIIDFDSTFTQVEALDELAKISLKGNPDQEEILKKIEGLTNLAMEGQLSFSESLMKRVQLLSANQKHLALLVKKLKNKVSTSFSRNKTFFKKHADEVLIVSGGFKEFITPVVSPYHIKSENIYANTFKFDPAGNIIGYDVHNPLSEEGGKVKLLHQLALQGDLYGIGDGYSDFQLRESGLIQKFYAYTENIAREKVIAKADHITPSFDEFLYDNNLPRAISYPKNRILCLIVGDVPPNAIALLKKDGFSIRHKSTFEEKYTKDVGMLVLGANESVSDEQLIRAIKLKTIGHFGTSKGHLKETICNQLGIVIFDNKKHRRSAESFIPQRMIDFMNKGTTYMSSNFPNLQLPAIEKSHRLIHIHRNVPGMLAQINTLLAKHEVNIVAQFLMTKKNLGYVIVDIDAAYDKGILKSLKTIENTVKFRVLY
ncbi:MAG: phosphoserine phosphatase [Pedobacter sp.]|nr:MAG: phosphoserine phosphatase [Pedobacter sp.]